MHILQIKEKIFILSVVVAYVVFSIVCIYVSTFLPANLIVHNEDMRGKRIMDFPDFLNDLENTLLADKRVLLYYQDKHYDFTLEELGISTNMEEINKDLQEIYSAGLILTIGDYIDIYRNPREYKFKYRVDRDTFLSRMMEIDQPDLVAPINAELKYIDGEVRIVQEQYGLEFDKKKVLDLIQNQLVHTENIILQMPTRNLSPDITSDNLREKGINELVAQYTTTFNPGQLNRTNNLRLASKAIDGTILAPGEEFSFNKTVGERTVERGYKSSPIYVGAQIREGIGGGICQVSSTLYNAVLLGDLEVLERSNHSLTVPYVPLSHDAAVSWNVVDFRFSNNTDFSIYIHSRIDNNKLTFELHSSRQDKEIVLKSERISTIPTKVNYIYDPNLQEGTEVVVTRGQLGYTSRLIKEIYIGGELIDRQVVSTDKYYPTTTVIRKGSD